MNDEQKAALRQVLQADGCTLSKDYMAMSDVSAVRLRAWATRRAKYGPRGHRGSYSRTSCTINWNGMMELLIRLHLNAVVSEGQLAKAMGLGRIDVRILVDDYRLRTGREYVEHAPSSVSETVRPSVITDPSPSPHTD